MLGDALVHHWAVAVALDVGVEAHGCEAPPNFAPVGPGHAPSCEVGEVHRHAAGRLLGDRVDEGIPLRTAYLKIVGEVKEVKVASEAFTVQEGDQHVPMIAPGNIPQHQCCARNGWVPSSRRSLPLVSSLLIVRVGV